VAPHRKLVHVRADLREDRAREALAGVDVLFHLGFALWRGVDGAHLNLDGTRNVLAARPGRIVLASSAAVYGAWPGNPLPLTEDHWPRPNPECPYAVQKLQAERICGESAPTVALRISAVLGPHTDRRVAGVVTRYRWAVPAIRGRNEALQFLHEDDAASAIHLAGASVANGVLNVAPEDWLDASDIAAIAGSRVLRMPRRLVLGGSEAGYRLRLLPFGADRAILVDGPLALDPSRAARDLSWRATRNSTEVLAGQLAIGK
jgi:UDP-glucose 4-epimerase